MPDQGEKKSYFVAKARGMKIAGFVKEKKTAGIIDVPEQPLRFHDHLFVTSDKKEIKFIHDTKAFGKKDIREFDNLKDAMGYRAGIEKKMVIEQEGKVETSYTEVAVHEGRSAEAVVHETMPVKE